MSILSFYKVTVNMNDTQQFRPKDSQKRIDLFCNADFKALIETSHDHCIVFFFFNWTQYILFVKFILSFFSELMFKLNFFEHFGEFVDCKIRIAYFCQRIIGKKCKGFNRKHILKNLNLRRAKILIDEKWKKNN